MLSVRTHNLFLIAAFLMTLFGSTACGGPRTLTLQEDSSKRDNSRVVTFADRQWRVKRAGSPVGPGPNFFSDREQSVWVDDEGLHLTIQKRGLDWFCSEVILQESLGYGTYVFQTRGRVDIIDPRVIVGLFTWDTDAPEHAYRELDVEFARWSNPRLRTNAQYVVQPCSACPGCGDRCERFKVDLTDEENDLTHFIEWSPGRASFRMYRGGFVRTTPPEDALVYEWSFMDESVPPAGQENLRFNLWLDRGLPPINEQPHSVVITDFTFHSRSAVEE